jgi:hypothetical protein
MSVLKMKLKLIQKSLIKILTGVLFSAGILSCGAYGLDEKFNNPDFYMRLTVFQSSISTMGDMSAFSSIGCTSGGIGSANCGCQALANSAGLSTNGEEFRAWLATSSTSAYCNLLNQTGTNCSLRPVAWYLPGTDTIALAKDQYSSGTGLILLQGAINLDETGAEVLTGSTWTGSDNEGLPKVNCSEWSSSKSSESGMSGFTNDALRWSLDQPVGCQTVLPLYCVQVPPSIQQ